MVNTANAEGRVYRAERSHGKKNRRKFSSIMAMVLGAIVTIEIMIMGAMVLKLDFHSADRIALALGFMVLYSGVVRQIRENVCRDHLIRNSKFYI